MAAKKYVWIVVPKYGKKYVVGRFSAEETAKKYVQTLNAPFNYLIKKQAVESDSEMKSNPVKKKFSPAQIAAQKLFAERARAGTLKQRKKRKPNPEKAMQVYTVFHRGTSNVAGTVRETSPKAAKEKIANRLGIPTLTYLVARKGERLQNPDKSKPRAYVKRASQITGAPPSKRLQTRRKMALKAPAGYFPNPSNQKLSAIDVDFLTGRKNIFGEINTSSEKKAQLEFLKNSRMTSKPVSSKYYNLTARVNRKTNPAAMMTGYQVICMHPKKHVVGIFKTMAEAKMVARAMADAKGVAYGVKTVKVHKSHFAV